MERGRALALLLVALALSSSAIYVLSLPQPELDEVNLAMSYWHRYITEHYRPEPINPMEIGDHPPEHFIEDIPWISYRESYCASTCLQMIAYRYGIEEPIEYFNLIMGFTCGAYLGLMGGRIFFIPGSDPLAGLAKASDYLGLRYRMLVTSDEELFLRAARYLISRDLPVILPVNGSRLYGWGGFSPHFVLAVGYDGDEIYIYEPVMAKEEIRYGERGIGIRDEALAKAAMEMIRGMGYPVSWNYSLIIYAPGGEVRRSISDALRDCGELQLGMKFAGTMFGIYTGAHAFEALAKAVEDGRISPEAVEVGLRMAVASRRDNAGFIRSAFPEDPGARRIADLLERVADICEESIELLERGYSAEIRELVAEKLREAAGYEREAGLLMSSYAR